LVKVGEEGSPATSTEIAGPPNPAGLQGLRKNSKLGQSWSARVQAGSLEFSTCPSAAAEGRYMNQNRALTKVLQGLEPGIFKPMAFAIEAGTHKDLL